MKIKIFALIMAVFCLSTLFVGCDQKCTPHADENADLICDNCGEALAASACKPHADADNNYVCDNCNQALTVPCETHKDDNADKLCDDCGLAVVTITQLVPPTSEERVDMVVNPLPESANPGDFIEADVQELISSATKLDGNAISAEGNYIYMTRPELSTTGVNYNRHIVFNYVTNEIVYETNDLYEGTYVNAHKTVYITLSPYYFRVTVSVSETNEFLETNTTTPVDCYFGYNKDVLYNVVEQCAEPTLWVSPVPVFENDVAYVAFDNTVYAFDEDNGEFIAKLDKTSLIYRPEFDEVNDNYGFVEVDNTVLAYDLTKWVDCVYSYAIPAHYENCELFSINNGRILLQASVQLLDTATSYDYINYGSKYDLVYVVIDPASKTATEVEFGYYIVNASFDADNAEWNRVVAYPIVDDRINANNQLDLITDKDLKILFNNELGDATLVSENILLVKEEIGNGYYINKLINVNGEFIAYVPVGASIFEDYILYDGKIYNFSMQEILDPEKLGYTITYFGDNYLLITKQTPTVEDPAILVTEYYYYNVSAKEATKSTLVDYSVSFVNDLFFVVRNSVLVNDPETGNAVSKTVYSVFNSNNQLVFESEKAYVDYIALGDGVYGFTMADNTFYVVK